MLLNYFQKIDNIISYLLGNYLNEKKFLKKKLKKNITFIDIGANVGTFSEFINDNFLIKDAYLFEPSVSSFNYLNNKFGKNNNFFIKNIGLSNKKGKKIFYEYKLSSQSSFYKLNKSFQSLGGINKKYYVNFFRLDSVLKSIGFVDLCKIDAQGEDLNILKGMSLILKKRLIKIIKIELSFINFYEKNDLNYLDIINFLSVYKYKLINISKIKYFKNQIGFCDAYFELSE
jgi:hypothetical protein